MVESTIVELRIVESRIGKGATSVVPLKPIKDTVFSP